MRRLILLLMAAVAAAATPAGAVTRFDAYVAGAGSGRGHSFVVGDGLYLVFSDRGAARTPYRVCWVRSDGRGRRCWTRTTGSRGAASKIFTAAPYSTGTWRATWFVRGRAVARWTFYNGVGD
jgi:hypothetical protein